jgi:hypothetical protein
MWATISDSQIENVFFRKLSGFLEDLWKTLRNLGNKSTILTTGVCSPHEVVPIRKFHAKKLFFDRMVKIIVEHSQVPRSKQTHRIL